MRHKIISSLTYIFHFMNVLRKFLPSMEKAPVNFSSLFVRKDIITNVSSRNIVIHINIFLIFWVSKFQFISTLHAPVQSSVLPLLLFLCHMYSWPGMNFYIFIQDNKLKEYNNVVATSNVINLIKTLLYPTLGISISLNYLSISQTIYIISCSLFCC